MNIKKHILLIDIIYILFVVIFLFRLNSLNKILLSIKFKNDIELLFYNDYIPIKYFGFAFLFFIIGIGIILYKLFYIRHNYLEFEETLFIFFSIVTIIVLIILLFVFINNPILRAIMASIGMLIGFIYVSQDD